MIFQATHQQVLNGTKTQTRRVVKPGECALVRTPTKPKLQFLFGKYDHYLIDAERGRKLRNPEDKIIAVFSAKEFTKWAIGQNYAVQPGRGKKSLGRTPPIKEIRQERLQDITMKDIYAEGTLHWVDRQFVEMYAAFIEMWDSIHGKGPHCWKRDPEVWVLDFGLIGKTSA